MKDNLIMVNGIIVEREEARISPFDRGFMFGDGVFEITPVYNGRPLDAEKHMENLKSDERKAADREEAEPERVNAEIVYTPMVAEAHEYQYNADAFEARGGADVKVGTAEKVSKVREDKAR